MLVRQAAQRVAVAGAGGLSQLGGRGHHVAQELRGDDAQPLRVVAHQPAQGGRVEPGQRRRNSMPGRIAGGRGVMPGQHLLQGAVEQVRIHRLRVHRVHAGRETALAILRRRVGRHAQDRLALQARVRADAARGLVAVHAGHLHVHDHQVVGRIGLQPRQRLHAVAGQRRDHADALQQVAQHDLVELVVLHHQHAFAGEQRAHPRQIGGPCGVGGVAAAPSFRAAEPDREREGAAPTRFAVEEDRAAHRMDQAVTDRQPQPRAAVHAGRGVVGLREGREQPLLLQRRDADAGVLHAKAQVDRLLRAASALDADVHRPALGELHCVARQVEQHLLDAHRIALQSIGHVGRDPHAEREPLAPGHQPGNRLDLLEHALQVQGLVLQDHPAGFYLREVEHVVDDLHQAACGLLGLGQVVALPRIEVGLQAQVGEADDGIQRRPDLVAHVREECALGARRRLGNLLGLDEFARAQRHVALETLLLVEEDLILALLLGDVGLHRHEVLQPAGGVADRRDLQRHPVRFTAAGVVQQLLAGRDPGLQGIADAADRGRIGAGPLKRLAGRSADQFGKAEAGAMHEGLVHPLDPALGVGDDDEVVRATRHQRKLGDLVLGRLAGRDVMDDAQEAALGQPGQRHVGPAPRAVATLEAHFGGSRRTTGPDLQKRLEGIATLGLEVIADVAAKAFPGLLAEDGLPGAVDEHETVVRRRLEDHLGEQLDAATAAVLGFEEGLAEALGCPDLEVCAQRIVVAHQPPLLAPPGGMLRQPPAATRRSGCGCPLRARTAGRCSGNRSRALCWSGPRCSRRRWSRCIPARKRRARSNRCTAR